MRASSRCPASRLLRWRLAWVVALLLGGAAACSPALDWREFAPEGGELTLTFPCRPDRHARAVTLGDVRVQMTMLVCDAGDATYAVSYFDVADPTRITASLEAWRTAAASNVAATAPAPMPFAIRGETPNPAAGRIALDGRLPDGAPVREHAAFFVRGLRVYAATVIGARPPAQAIDTFFGALRFPG